MVAPLHKVKIISIPLKELMPNNSILLVDFIKQLMNLYESFSNTHKNVTSSLDCHNVDNPIISLYGYTEMSEIEIERTRTNINKIHDYDYNSYLSMKEKFIGDLVL